MGTAPLVELEALVAQMVQRRWAVRAALVNDHGDVVAMRSARGGGEREGANPRGDESIDMAGGVARMVVERVDEQVWVYVDLGVMRLLARLTRANHAPTATSWLALELSRIGFTVERDTPAQD